MVGSRCLGIGPPSGIPPLRRCFCWPPIFVAIYRHLGNTPPSLSCLIYLYIVEKREVDALGGTTIFRGCFERCCSNNKTLTYHSNLSCVTLRTRRPTLLRAPAYRTPSEASSRRRCGHACRFLCKRAVCLGSASGQGTVESTEGNSKILFRDLFWRWGVLRFTPGAATRGDFFRWRCRREPPKGGSALG